MDQMACTLAGDGQALFLDTRSLDWSLVPLPAEADSSSSIPASPTTTRRVTIGPAARSAREAASPTGRRRSCATSNVERLPAWAALPDRLAPRPPRHHRGRPRPRRRGSHAIRATCEALGRLFYALLTIRCATTTRSPSPEIDLHRGTRSGRCPSVDGAPLDRRRVWRLGRRADSASVVAASVGRSALQAADQARSGKQRRRSWCLAPSIFFSSPFAT